MNINYKIQVTYAILGRPLHTSRICQRNTFTKFECLIARVGGFSEGGLTLSEEKGRRLEGRIMKEVTSEQDVK